MMGGIAGLRLIIDAPAEQRFMIVVEDMLQIGRARLVQAHMHDQLHALSSFRIIPVHQ